jgi:hypothetical protein
MPNLILLSPVGTRTSTDIARSRGELLARATACGMSSATVTVHPVTRGKRISMATSVAALLLLIAGCGSTSTPAGPASSSGYTLPPPPPMYTATATTTETTTAPLAALPVSLDGPLRGFFSKPAVWDQSFGAATAAECTEEGDDGLSPVSAWRLPGGALACAGNPSFGAWDGRVVYVNVYFDPPVDSATALKQLAAIYPADAQLSGPVAGVNGAASGIPDGSCEDAVFTSAALGVAVSQVNPSWPGQVNKSSVALYSGGATSGDGALKPFRPAVVKLAGIGLHDSGPDEATC